MNRARKWEKGQARKRIETKRYLGFLGRVGTKPRPIEVRAGIGLSAGSNLGVARNIDDWVRLA